MPCSNIIKHIKEEHHNETNRRNRALPVSAACDARRLLQSARGGSTNTPSADPSASIPSTGSPEGAKKIGLVQINTTNSYYVGASEAFHKGAEDFGYELDEQFAENSLEEEISIIENFIELGYDMIIADPQDAEALEDVFQKGRDSGVIMVSLRSPHGQRRLQLPDQPL